MDIDLGDKPVANVKLAGNVYSIALPTVKQSQRLKELLDQDESKSIDVFCDFMCGLGMPKDVIESLSVHQLTKLASGLMGDPGKK